MILFSILTRAKFQKKARKKNWIIIIVFYVFEVKKD